MNYAYLFNAETPLEITRQLCGIKCHLAGHDCANVPGPNPT